MKKIFIGGSRRLSHLNRDILTRIDNIIASSFTILIGDANGADKSVQKHCAGINYQNVIVFCSGSECRNNIGNWRTFHISAEKKTRDIHFYTAKDLEMAKEADYGFMIWDGKSKGTFNNINELTKLSKKVLVYFQPQGKFHKISAVRDIEKLLANCDKIFREEFEKKLHLLKKENYTDPILVLSGMIFALRAESEKSSVFGLKNPAYGLKKLFWRIRNFRAKENQNWISI